MARRSSLQSSLAPLDRSPRDDLQLQPVSGASKLVRRGVRSRATKSQPSRVQAQQQCTVQITGTPGNDVLVGTPANDSINGLAGDDVVVGLQGEDCLFGGDGE